MKWNVGDAFSQFFFLRKIRIQASFTSTIVLLHRIFHCICWLVTFLRETTTQDQKKTNKFL